MPEPDDFVQPEGAAGALAGMVMAQENAQSEQWAAAQVSGHGLVLEVGCGPGVGLAALGPRGVGVDLSGCMVLQARHRAPEAAVVRGDAAFLPFATGAFAAAVAVHSLALLSRKALREVRRALTVDAPFLAVHRLEAQGGPPPASLVLLLEASGYREVTWQEEAGRTVVRARA